MNEKIIRSNITNAKRNEASRQWLSMANSLEVWRDDERTVITFIILCTCFVRAKGYDNSSDVSSPRLGKIDWERFSARRVEKIWSGYLVSHRSAPPICSADLSIAFRYQRHHATEKSSTVGQAIVLSLKTRFRLHKRPTSRRVLCQDERTGWDRTTNSRGPVR